MNLMVNVLAEDELASEPHNSTTLVVEDCIGEAVHIHCRNIRLEMSINDFSKFVSNINEAELVLEEWEL